jgi:hypothetical protein
MPRTVRSSASVTYVAGMFSSLIKIEGAKGYKAPSTLLLSVGYATIHLYAPAATLDAIAP